MTDEQNPQLRKAHISLARRVGGSPAAREHMEAANAEFIWHGTCRKCRKVVKGTPAELLAHECNGQSS